MIRIKKVVITTEEGLEMTFEGTGQFEDVRTVVPKALIVDGRIVDQPTRYITVTLKPVRS